MNTTKALMKALPLVASMLGDKFGVKVVIGHHTTASTDGKRIYLPKLPMTADETLARLIRGYIDHEAAHIRHTDFSAVHDSVMSGAEKFIWNAIEDWRVEHEIIKRYPGCHEHFQWLIRHIFLEKREKAEDSSPAFSILNYILLTLRSWDVPELAQKCRTEAMVIDTYWPSLRHKIDKILDRIPDICHTTHSSIHIARKIIDLLEKTIKLPKMKMSLDDARDEKNEGRESSVPSSSESTRPSSMATDTQDSQAEADKRDQAKDALKKLLQSDDSDLPNSFDKRLSKAVWSGKKQKRKSMGIAQEGNSKPVSLDEQDIHEALSSSRAMRTRIQAYLQSHILRRSQPARYGRCCGHLLHRLPINNPRLFRKNEEVIGIDTAVHILLDASGSMGGNIKLATQACYAIASCLSTIQGISLGVTSFPAEYSKDDEVTVCPVLRHGERVSNLFRVDSGGSTPLAESLLWVGKQIVSLPQPRKLILLITDGVPNNEDAALKAIQGLQSLNIELAGIAINSPRLADILTCQENITNIHELAPAMFRILHKKLTTIGG